MQRIRLGTPLFMALASSALLSACSDGDAQRGGGLQGYASARTTEPGIDSISTAQTSSSPNFFGGQSGGDGSGATDEGTNVPSPSGPDIIEGPPRPCACMNAASAGTVLSIGDGCARVEVTEIYAPNAPFEVGDVIGGIFENACRHELAARVGDQVLFQYYPGRTDECPAYRQCVNECVGVGAACREMCLESTLASCTDPAAWSLQTGRFSALVRQDENVSFYFAGQDRTASIEELTSPQCLAEQGRILEEPDGLAAWRRDRDNAPADPSYDPVDCFEPEEQEP